MSCGDSGPACAAAASLSSLTKVCRWAPAGGSEALRIALTAMCEGTPMTAPFMVAPQAASVDASARPTSAPDHREQKPAIATSPHRRCDRHPQLYAGCRTYWDRRTLTMEGGGGG